VENRKFEIFKNNDRENTSAVLNLSAPTITGSEQNIVLLDENLQLIGTFIPAPGFDRRQKETTEVMHARKGCPVSDLFPHVFRGDGYFKCQTCGKSYHRQADGSYQFVL
jgi:hypothetical protein